MPVSGILVTLTLIAGKISWIRNNILFIYNSLTKNRSKKTEQSKFFFDDTNCQTKRIQTHLC